jgi:hypothetical protein
MEIYHEYPEYCSATGKVRYVSGGEAQRVVDAMRRKPNRNRKGRQAQRLQVQRVQRVARRQQGEGEREMSEEQDKTAATQSPHKFGWGVGWYVKYLSAVQTIEEYNKLVEHAAFIAGGADNESFLRLSVATTGHLRLSVATTGHLRLVWPELRDGGYYDAASIEAQMTLIEPSLFVQTREQIEATWAAEAEARERIDREKQRRHYELQARMDANIERDERAMLARLKSKYEGGGA